MKFFDSKNEVIDIQLTQKGKKLLAEGKFKPSKYSFHDNDVIYDGRYGGVTEHQTNIEPRIQENTPLLRTQYSFTTVDNLASTETSDLIPLNTVINLTPISKRTTLGTEKAPRWQLHAYDGQIVSGSGTMTGSVGVLAPVTQLDMKMNYLIRPFLSSETNALAEGEDPYEIYFMEDNSFLKTYSSNLIVDLKEENTPFENENFEIEVYKFEQVGTDKKLRRLNFLQRPVYIVDGVLLEEPQMPPSDLQLDNTFVEYYFDFAVDGEIPTTELCDAVAKLKSRGIYIDSEFECPDNDPFSFPDIYSTNIEDSDIEDC
tara:strand:- start:516 stop:1460 length:945 start_codon:yes stop_codon:yes gene_type:complete